MFAPAFVRGVITLYEAVRDNDEAKAADAYEILGFTQPVARKDGGAEPLGALPLRAADPGPRAADPGNRRPGVRPRGAGEVHAGLKRTGGVRLPREFLLMDRAAIGLGSVFLRLQAELNWRRLFMD